MAEDLQRFRLMMSHLSKDIKKFENLKTNVDRMNFVYNQVLRFRMYPSFQEDKKNDEVAIKNREQGNLFFKKKSYRKALDYYTESLLHAKSKEILALAYANRSAALSKLNLYQECLMDIDRALKNNYPDNLKPKLLARQIHAKFQTTVVTKYFEDIPSIPDSEKNPQIQCAKNCVKIVKNEQYGRHIVATRNIQIGEILAIESPYSSIIEEQIYVHCHECLNLCYNLFPCEKCTKALYCTKDCKDRAFNKYHKYECPILLSLDSDSSDLPKRLALRTLFCSKTEWDDDLNEVDTIYRSNRFKEVYNLESHALKRGVENLLLRTTVASGLYILLKNHTTFFEDCTNEDKVKDVLLQLILVCDINLLNVYELAYVLGIPEQFATASGIYPFYALFNHSCCPNITRQCHGSTIILRARSSIKADEQCFVVYGVHFAQSSRHDRQMYLLKNHFFSCTCRACVENWTMWDLTNIGLKWSSFQLLTTVKLVGADVYDAKKELPQLLIQAKKAERSLPPGRDFLIQDVVTLCYHLLGNKRKI